LRNLLQLGAGLARKRAWPEAIEAGKRAVDLAPLDPDALTHRDFVFHTKPEAQ
jgi:hypothetical protein